jgi:hypothetical protein
MIMQCFAYQSHSMAWIAVFLLCLSCSFLIPVASAADIEMEGYLGETITLHGVSYVGDSVYLFLTGPGLPENGVTLTNTDLRADQGQFTVVGLDDNQEWTYIWKTSRIANEIDYGTYVVYVTNEPVDKAHLGGTSSYKTLSIFLKDSGSSKVSIDSGKSYTLKPEEHVSTPRPAPSINITNITPSVTSLPPTTTISITPLQTTVPATRAGTGPWVAVTALLCGVSLISFQKARI